MFQVIRFNKKNHCRTLIGTFETHLDAYKYLYRMDRRHEPIGKYSYYIQEGQYGLYTKRQSRIFGI